MSSVFISICIPAYKRIDFLKKLLDSIAIQNFRDFEVVITDDSPSDEVRIFCKKYENEFNLYYYKNIRTLGTPENWNEAIRRAEGEWIKLMHDDDWFADATSLGKFAQAAKKCQADFIFSGYTNIYIEKNKSKTYVMGWYHRYLLRKSPVNLLKNNFIGHPSTTIIKNNLAVWYDGSLKWVVDIEFYIRILKSGQPYHYIAEPLINLGMSSDQVTASAFRNPAVEIPENIELLKKISTVSLRKIFVYDYYWRFIRNLSIRSMDVVRKYYAGFGVPVLLQKMVRQQKYFPVWLIRIGVASKILMLATYFWNRLNSRIK